ncbi:hypothetical protein SAY87_009923 [Trapa incisa]|uniref:RING-type domain-containing protein n=1 Tax=Trapa incisa TaxID=236973 RepID=A0AAN7GH11_9MYRT|nr:hypothetical protein SAY87_009923 [Trapa incisa]
MATRLRFWFTHMMIAILNAIASHLPLMLICKSRRRQAAESEIRRHPDDHRPPAALVPLPPHLVGASIKKRLPLTRISEHGGAMAGCRDGSAWLPVCVVCMNAVDAKEEIRQLSNCRHVFHADCLDRWIDEGHVTCPLCRSKLLPPPPPEADDDHDPWRMERMIYLFGEDIFLELNRDCTVQGS